MKVLVTGGSGFIGSKLVKAVIEAGYKVRLLSRRDVKQFQSHCIEIIRCDLLDSNYDLEHVVDGCAVIFNCVGELHDETLMQKLHVDATKRLINACNSVTTRTGNSIHFVQLSSVGAYGPNSNKASSTRVVTEETIPSPVGTYEITKTQADELIIAAAKNDFFSYTILRPSNVYGASMPNNSIRQWGQLVKKKMFFYVGKPGATATYIHVDDVVEALLLCGFDSRAKNNIFNISNDCAQEDVVRAFAEKFHVNEPQIRLPEGLVRLLTNVFSGFKKVPLSHSRIDALVSRTSYPTNKLARVLEFRPTRDARLTIGEIFEDKSD